MRGLLRGVSLDEGVSSLEGWRLLHNEQTCSTSITLGIVMAKPETKELPDSNVCNGLSLKPLKEKGGSGTDWEFWLLVACKRKEKIIII